MIYIDGDLVFVKVCIRAGIRALISSSKLASKVADPDE